MAGARGRRRASHAPGPGEKGPPGNSRRLRRRPKLLQSLACFFPQHGPGKKHERRIELAEWQDHIVARSPEDFLRGLFHSDGCRVTNKVRRGEKTYLYARYMFANESADIMRLCQKSLDRLHIEWRMCRPNLLSVARREGVARLDEFVGPKW